MNNDQGVSHLLVPKGEGAPWHPLRKLFSQRNFVMNTTLYIYTLKPTIFKQNPKGFFNEFWVIVEEN